MPYTKESAMNNIAEIIEMLESQPDKKVIFENRLAIRPGINSNPLIVYGVRTVESHVIEINYWKVNKAVWEKIHPANANVGLLLKGLLGKLKPVEA